MGCTRFRSFDGTEIAWEAHGSGSPTLVLTDGIGCAGFVWRFIIPEFARRHRIIHWHYPGHGESSPPPDFERTTIPDLAHHLECVLEAARVEGPFVLVGHSMGVQVIFEFAIRNPSRALALIPMCGSYGFVLDTFHGNGILKTLQPYILRLVDRAPSVAHMVWRALGASRLVYDIATLTELNGDLLTRENFQPYQDHIATLDLQLFGRMMGFAAEHTVEHTLRSIETPALIVAGDKDSFTPYWLSQRMHALLPHSRLVRLALGSHAAPIELPDHTNLAIESFLHGLSTRAPHRSAGVVRPSARRSRVRKDGSPEVVQKFRSSSRGRGGRRAPH